ncbi:hypothetical protein F4805DRAFT_458734 [Annulohypoxylon moriforme]|nr:hypothetical protein F4805DRAFT_458734 [Annulohypoxylon moriforme]
MSAADVVSISNVVSVPNEVPVPNEVSVPNEVPAPEEVPIPDEEYKWTKMKSTTNGDYEIGVRLSDIAKFGGMEKYESELTKARAADPDKERSTVTRVIFDLLAQVSVPNTNCDLFQVVPPWRVQSNDKWQPTNPASAVATSLHITHYALRPSPAPFYSHRLDVNITSTGWHGRTFWFIDESPDEYELYAFFTGAHSIRYHSYKPTIVKIRTA